MVIISDITKLHEKMANAIIHSKNNIEIKINSTKMELQLREKIKYIFFC